MTFSRARQGIAATAGITDSATRPAIYAEQPIASKQARRQRIAVDVDVDVEPFWWMASAAITSPKLGEVIEPMVNLAAMAGRWSSSAPTTLNSSVNA